MKLRLQKFCCCCTTKTGSLVIGTIGWIFTLVEIFGFVDPRAVETQRKRQQELRDQLLELSRNREITEYEHNVDYGSGDIYYKVGYAVVSLIICVLLIVGIYKKNYRFILPWLVLKGFELSLLVIVFILLLIFMIIAQVPAGFVFLMIFIVCGVIALSFYFWLCVWSHYKDLQENEASNENVGQVYYTNTNVANIPPPAYSEKTSNLA